MKFDITIILPTLNEGEILKVQAADNDRLAVVASIQEFAKTRITTSAISGI